jgi:hypothetical protein
MQERIRPTFVIVIGTADYLEAQVTIESYGGPILLINVDGARPLDPIAQQTPYPTALRTWRDEQRIDLLARMPHDSDHRPLKHRDGEGRAPNVISNERINCLPVLRSKEIVTRVNRLSPDLKQLFRIARTASAQLGHDEISAKA